MLTQGKHHEDVGRRGFFPYTPGAYLAQESSAQKQLHFSLAKPTGAHPTQYTVMLLQLVCK